MGEVKNSPAESDLQKLQDFPISARASGFRSQISDDSGGEIWIGSFESKSPKQGQILAQKRVNLQKLFRDLFA